MVEFPVEVFEIDRTRGAERTISVCPVLILSRVVITPTVEIQVKIARCEYNYGARNDGTDIVRVRGTYGTDLVRVRGT